MAIKLPAKIPKDTLIVILACIVTALVVALILFIMFDPRRSTRSSSGSSGSTPVVSAPSSSSSRDDEYERDDRTSGGSGVSVGGGRTPSGLSSTSKGSHKTSKADQNKNKGDFKATMQDFVDQWYMEYGEDISGDFPGLGLRPGSDTSGDTTNFTDINIKYMGATTFAVGEQLPDITSMMKVDGADFNHAIYSTSIYASDENVFNIVGNKCILANPGTIYVQVLDIETGTVISEVLLTIVA